MTIEEARQQKLEVEIGIFQILAGFQSETGLTVVHVNLISTTMFGKKPTVESVNVEVAL